MPSSTGHFADFVSWLVMTDHQVVINNNRTLMKTYAFVGSDGHAMTGDQAAMYIAGLNNIFKRLKTGIILYFECQKQVDSDYPEETFASPLLSEMDADRKSRLCGGRNYLQKYYLTIVWRQPTAAARKVSSAIDKNNRELAASFKKGLFVLFDAFRPHNVKKEQDDFEEANLEDLAVQEKDFLEMADDLYRALQRYFVDIRPLTQTETLTYLHSTISETWHPISEPIDAFLVQNLSDSTFLTGRYPKLGSSYIGVVGIKQLPPSSRPFMFDCLNTLKSRYRFCIRYQALSKEDAVSEVRTIQNQHHQRQKSLVTMIMEAVKDRPIDKIDEEAVIDEEDARAAYEGLSQDDYGFGYYTIDVVLLNRDPNVLAEEAAAVKELVNSLGFVAVVEKDNAPEAWMSTIPSCWEFNIRKYLINSTNLACMAPFSALWEGQKKNKFFAESGISGAPLLKCATPESLPFYLNLHVDDVGHTVITGATGAGKSVLLNTIAANFQKYEGAKVFLFDKSASSRILTMAVGGNFYNILVDTKTISFQPLRNVDDPIERTWLLDWLCSYLTTQNMVLQPDDKKSILETLRSMATVRPNLRTITTFLTMLQNLEIRSALTALSLEGQYGALFDGDEDRFGSGRWQVFEMEKLMESEGIVASTLDYLFHRIEGQLDGSPALIILDECWLFFRNADFRAKIVEYLKDMRKKNCSVVLATQNLTDIEKYNLVDIINTNADTKIYLANDGINERTAEIYRQFGLNDREIDIVKNLTPKKEYFYKSPLGNRVFDLNLSPLEVAFLTATSKEDQRKAASMQDLSVPQFINEWKKIKSVS